MADARCTPIHLRLKLVTVVRCKLEKNNAAAAASGRDGGSGGTQEFARNESVEHWKETCIPEKGFKG